MAIETAGIASDIFSLMETLLAYFGAAVITYGGLIAIYQTLMLELRRTAHLSYKLVRGGFAARIILGLDFLIASDILTTIGHPNLIDVLVLGGIVLIRTVLTVILSQESRELDKDTLGTRPKVEM